MDKTHYARFSRLRDEFRKNVERWNAALPGLADAQRELAAGLGEDDYAVETPIVYNRALDDIGPRSAIRWLVVADNPGKREQAADQNRYLVGRSGMVAEGFFRRELGVEFRSEVAIINKTPVHTPKTAQLRKLAALYPEAAPVLAESQRFMAGLVPRLQACFEAKVWIMGLAELGGRGLFSLWREELARSYAAADPRLVDGVYCFNHFSMGSFATDLKRRRLDGESVPEAVLRIGAENRVRVFY